MPLTFGAEEHARWSALAQTSALVTRLAALLVGGLALASPLLLQNPRAGRIRPGDLDSVVALVALAGVPWAIYLPMSQVMFWERKTKPLLWVTPSAAVVNLILVVILLPPFGLAGAAAATCLAIMVQAGLAARAARSMADVPWPWREIALNAALAGPWLRWRSPSARAASQSPRARCWSSRLPRQPLRPCAASSP